MAGTQYSALLNLRASLLEALEAARASGDFSAYNIAIAATEIVSGLGEDTTVGPDDIPRWLYYRSPGYPALLIELARSNNDTDLIATYLERATENADRALSAESYASANLWDTIRLDAIAAV